MSKNTTEIIIQTLVKAGHSITFFPVNPRDNKNHSMCISIDDDDFNQISGDSFEELHENFIEYWVCKATENSKRIDGGVQCHSPWHILPDADKEKECPICQESISGTIKCPGCQKEITPENAGAYRTFCMDCVEKFPDFPEDGKGYIMEVGQFGDFKWHPENQWPLLSNPCKTIGNT